MSSSTWSPPPLQGSFPLVDLGFLPRAPVDPLDFAVPARREAWVRDKGMRVFSMFDRANPMRVIDLFASHPIDFEDLYARSECVPLESTTVRIASLEDLIQLKRGAGRPQDLIDVDRLQEIRRRREERTMTSDPEPPVPAVWSGSWREAADALLDSTLVATPAQHLAWLEEALEIATRAGRSQGVTGDADNPARLRPRPPER